MALFASPLRSNESHNGPNHNDSPLEAVLGEPSLNAHRLQLPGKSTVYQPTDPANHLYYIHTGQVRTYQIASNGSRRLVEILGPGEWCGAASLARTGQYGEIAEATTATAVSVIPVDRLFELLPQEPAVAADLIRQLAHKLASYREDASGLVFEDCNDRLIRTLVTLSASPAATPSEDGVIVHITHQQLAQKVGVARETISLALAQLRRKNLLRTGRNQLFFSPQSLQQATPRKPEPQRGEV